MSKSTTKATPAAEIIARAKARRAKHRAGSGFCHLCFRAELEEHLARENPKMKRDDVGKLVDEWILAADSEPH